MAPVAHMDRWCRLGRNARIKHMASRLDELLKQALELPESDRAQLAMELIDSVDGLVDPAAEAEWLREVEARARRVRADGSKGDDWPTVRARIEKKLQSR